MELSSTSLVGDFAIEQLKLPDNIVKSAAYYNRKKGKIILPSEIQDVAQLGVIADIKKGQSITAG